MAKILDGSTNNPSDGSSSRGNPIGDTTQRNTEGTNGNNANDSPNEHTGSRGNSADGTTGGTTGGTIPRNRTNTNNRATKRRKLKNAVGGVAKKYIFNAKTGKKVAKGITKGIVGGLAAGTLGTMGIAAGLASDDFSNVWKYGSMGAAGGFKLGTAATDHAVGLGKGIGNAGSVLRQGWEGNEYDEKVKKPKETKKWEKDADTRMHYKNKYDDWEKQMAEDKKMRDYGITDQDDLDRSNKLRKMGYTNEQSAYILQNKDVLTRQNLADPEKEKKLLDSFTESFGGNREAAERLINAAKIINDLN